MNRGRHRSRKHVEGQPGHAAKAMSAAVAATQPAALAASGAGATAAGLTVSQHQQPVRSYTAGAGDPCSLQYNRYIQGLMEWFFCSLLLMLYYRITYVSFLHFCLCCEFVRSPK